MLGMCFVEKGMPKLAVKWFEKGLAAPGRADDEYRGIRYDLADAFEQSGELQQALSAFGGVFGQDASFRDVGERIASSSREDPTARLAALSGGHLSLGRLPFDPELPPRRDRARLRALDPALGGQLAAPDIGLPREASSLSGFTRGAVSGLGLVNLVLALREACTPGSRAARGEAPMRGESREQARGRHALRRDPGGGREACRARGRCSPAARTDGPRRDAAPRDADRVLEAVASVSPWSERPRLLALVVLNPKAPRPLAQRLVSSLYWHDLAEVAATRAGAGGRARAR